MSWVVFRSRVFSDLNLDHNDQSDREDGTQGDQGQGGKDESREC
jgi:hypothetical protein